MSAPGRITIDRIAARAHENAVAKGFWDGTPRDSGGLTPSVHEIAGKLALIHSEVSEALECVRDDQMTTRLERDGTGVMKPEGLPIEIADVVIRCCELAEALDIDLAAAVLMKLDYNETRQHRHGGRRL